MNTTKEYTEILLEKMIFADNFVWFGNNVSFSVGNLKFIGTLREERSYGSRNLDLVWEAHEFCCYDKDDNLMFFVPYSQLKYILQ